RLLAVEQLERAELDLLLHAADPDYHGGAAAADRVVGGADRLGVADALERVVEALAAGHLELRALELVGRDAVGGAEALGHLELARQRVDRDDLRGARDPRALDRRDADAAAADHHHRAAERD